MWGEHLHKAVGPSMRGTFVLSAGHTGVVTKDTGPERMEEVGREEHSKEEPGSCLLLGTWVALASGLLAGHLVSRFGCLLPDTSKFTS